MSAAPHVGAPNVQQIPLAALVESPWNRRKHFDPKALAELAASLTAGGQITPIGVRPHPTRMGLFEIFAGHRRLRAAKQAGLESLTAVVRELSDELFRELLCIENLQREDLHPLEEAEGYAELLERNKHTVDTLAAKVGKSVSYIYQRLKLAELIPPAKKAFLEAELTAGHAILIARLQPKDQVRAMKELRPDWRGEQLTVRALGKWIAEQINLDLTKAPFPTDDAKLLPKAGACAICPKRIGCQPELFADIAKGDVCTDPACYRAKADAQLERRKEELRKTKTPFVQIATDYDFRGKGGPIHPYHWKRAAAKSCKHVTMGLVVSGDERGASFTVCTNERCRTHFKSEIPARSSYKPSPAEKARIARERKEQEKAKARAAVLPAVLARRLPGLLQRIAARVDQFRGVPDVVILGLARGMTEEGARFWHDGRDTRYIDAIETAVQKQQRGKWRKDWWGRNPLDATAARQFLGLEAFLALDAPALDQAIDKDLDAELKKAATTKTAKASPTFAGFLSVRCPQCNAKPGSPCRRPSGHNTFGGEPHTGRVKAAAAASKRKAVA